MPLYSIQGPDGRTYSIEGPPGATREQVIQAIQARMQDTPQTFTAPPVPQPEQSGFFRQVLDVPVQVSRGMVGGIRMLADVFGSGSSASEALKSADTWLADLLSAQAKNDQRQVAQILKDAEDKGVLDQVKAGFQAFLTAPVDTLSQALGSTAPVVIAGLASGPVGAVLGTARLGAVAMPAVGAAMGVGEVKGSIYESVKQAYKQKGASDEVAEAKAQEAQAYSSANLPSMAVAGGLGALAGGMGIEKPLAGMLSRRTAAEMAERQALAEAERGVASRVGLGALREGAPEFAQAGQSKLAENIALRNEGFDVPLFQGVFGAAAMEGTAGAVLGGGLSAPRPAGNLLPGQKVGESDADFARRLSREIDAARQREQIPNPLTQPISPAEAPAEAPTQPIVSTEGADLYRLPDGTTGTLEQAKAYAMSVPPQQRMQVIQQILANRIPKEAVTPPDLFTKPVEEAAEVAEKPAEMPVEVKPVEGVTPAEVPVEVKPAEEIKQAEEVKPVEAVRPTEEIKVEEIKPGQAVTKEEEEAAVDAAKGKQEQNFLLEYPIFEIPIDQLTLSKDVPQFKGDADTKGLVEQLEGKFDQRGVAPIQVWKRNDGRLEVISGRHRFDLAQRSGEKLIRAQIHEEATGFDADQASILDAELNIRDQQGKGKDYVAYFKKSGLSEEEASARGLLGRAPGKPAFAIAKNGSEELVAAHRADIVSDAGAAAIANAAPGDSRLQAVGIKAIQEGKSPLAAVNLIKAVQKISKDQPPSDGGDLFGFDDSAMREAEDMAKIATLKQNQLAQRLAAISGASRRPEIAKKEGIDIKDPEALKKREKELRQQKAAWDNWPSSPELVQEIRQEMAPKAPEEAKPSVREAPAAKEPSPELQAKIDLLGKALTRIMSRYGLKDVALKLVADMKAEGEYSSKVLSLALDATDPVSALRHESIHAMKELGFFSDQQWKSLERQAKEKWIDQYLKQKNVNRQPLKEGQTSRYDAYMRLYGGDEEAVIEEAIADAFADFDATKAPPGMLQALLKKIRNFFQAIKEAFGAEPDAERIFRKAERGALKPFAVPQVNGQSERLSLSLPEDYRGEHRAPTKDSGSPAHELSGAYPDDVYSANGPRYYAHYADSRDLESFEIIRRVRNKPNVPLTIYRAVPKSAPSVINNGDWVTISKRYAKEHGEGPLRGNYKIISKLAHPRDIFTNGDSIHEWGYDPQPMVAREEAKKRGFKYSLREVPLSTRGLMESAPVYAMAELGLKTTSEKKPGGIELFNDVRSIATALNQDTIARDGAMKQGDTSSASGAKLARAMADEIAYQVGTTAKTGTGLGWYSNNYPKSVQKLAKRFPELERSEYARTVFSALVAITSNGEKVAINVKNAIRLYADVRDGKELTSPGSRRDAAMENNLAILKTLMDKYGPDLRAELMREITVKDMNAALRQMGEKPDSSYLADTKVPASALYFGPKLGAFFSNLEGAEGYLTMDLWWTRTINRMRGLLIPKATPNSINNFRSMMDQPNATREEVVSATIPLKQKYEQQNFTTELEFLVAEKYRKDIERQFRGDEKRIAKEVKKVTKEPSTKSPNFDEWHRIAKKMAGPAYQQLLFEHKLEKLANTIHKNEYEMLEEAPFTASDRAFMYRTARYAQRLLKQKDIDLSLADIQAALWYYEKRLYQHLSGRKADDIGYDEAITQLAGQSTGPAGSSVVFDGQPVPGVGPAGAGTEAGGVRGKPAEQPRLSLRAPQTEAFKRWFGDSKVVDGNGEPLVVYHGTSEDIQEFDLGRSQMPLDEQGIYFTTSPVYAGSGYADRIGGNVVPVYLKAKRLYEVTDAQWQRAEGMTPREARARGYDAYVVRGMEGGDTYIVFEPTQIKSATGNIGTFDPTNPDIRYSLRDKLGMYSELENKIEVGSNKAPAASWKAYINGLTQKGVKPEEIEWSGVKDWLDLQKGTVTKEELLNYLKQGGVQVEETVLGGKSQRLRWSEWSEPDESGDARSTAGNYTIVRADDGKFDVYEESAGTLDEALDSESAARQVAELHAGNSSAEQQTKYSRYALPGGENYREVLLTLPSDVDAKTQRLLNEERYLVLSPEDRAKVDAAKKKAGVQYRSTHWDQPNVLAHIRLNDRTDADGNKVLFVEEIQSDWGQEGKKKGFKGAPLTDSEKKRLAELTAQVDDASGMAADLTPAERAEFGALTRRSDSGTGVIGVPSAPFVTKTEGWLNLALKRIMVMAAEGGYDKVAFVNGKQSAERYDLSKQVDDLRYGDGILVALKDGKIVLSKETTPEELPDLVGKEVADRLLKAPEMEGNGYRRLSGLDLKVGGEGMKTFYDTIVPTAVKKLLPKVGGGQMEMVDVQVPPASAMYPDKTTLRETIQQSGFDVTPAMRNKVQTTGLPRFSLRDTVNVDGTERPATSSTNKPIYPTEEGTKNFWRWFKDSAVVDDEGRPLVVYRGVDTDYGTTARVSKEGALGAGIYTTPSASFASSYAEGEAPNVMPLYVSLQKPLLLKHKGNEDPMIMALVQLGMKQDKAEAMVEKAYEEKGYIGKQVMNRALSQGYDGLMQYRDGKLTEIVAFNPTQIKSAIGNVGKFDPVEPSIKASLRDATDPVTRARIDQITTPREEKSFIKRITEAIAPKSASSFRAAFLDRYNRLSEYDKELVLLMGGAPLLADASSHSAALMSDMSAGVLAGAMGVHDGVGGIPVYVNGHTKIVNNNNTVKGPIAIFAPLAKYNDPFIYQKYQFWAAVNRGLRLYAQGRDPKMITPADQAEAAKILVDHPEFADIQKEWIKFNDGLVQYLKDTGVLTEAAAKEFVKYADYIPFYRQADGEETVGPQIFASLSGVRAPKKLKGSEAPLGEFLETVVRNVQYSIEAGMKNVAAQRAVNTAVAIGQANRLNYVSSAPNVVKVLENGKTSYYETKDMLFVEAMKSLNLGDLPFIGLLAGPANLLRNLVTKDPAFMLANMMRDSMSAWVSSGVKMTPMVDTLTNFTKALRGQNPEYEALLNSGVIGGYDYSQGVEISARLFDRALRKKAGVYTPAEQLARPFVSLWDALEKGTTASDAATRMEIYKKTLAATGNEAEALFRAVEVMNFNRKGNNPMVRVLTAAVPFLNARMQGLDVLYRAAFGRGTEANAKEIQKSFFIRGMTIAALSTMYWMLASEDDEWKRQEQETRDNYWILGDVKIPIPFEIGVLFKVIPERILEYSFGDDTGKDFLKSMTRQLTSTLSFNPIPQTALPLIESVTNYSFFTGRPIVSQGLEDVNPAYQIAPGTSRIGELIGGATKDLPTALQLSPVKIDEMIRGYTGTIGGYMMDLFDAIYDMNTDAPKAAKRFEQMPVIRRFAVDPLARGQVTAYYELKNSVDEAVRTANLLERNMKPQEWGEFMQENMGLLATKDFVLDLEKSMKQYREMKNFVRASTMDAEGKKDIIANITELENNLASNIQEIKKMIDAQ
jgi:Holliday junction resolvasome RuvABC DNA-binding subunit